MCVKTALRRHGGYTGRAQAMGRTWTAGQEEKALQAAATAQAKAWRWKWAGGAQ